MPRLEIQYDEESDILTIEGVMYHGEYFRKLSKPNPDMLYKIEIKEIAIGKIISVKEIVDPRSKKYQKEVGNGGQ